MVVEYSVDILCIQGFNNKNGCWIFCWYSVCSGFQQHSAVWCDEKSSVNDTTEMRC